MTKVAFALTALAACLASATVAHAEVLALNCSAGFQKCVVRCAGFTPTLEIKEVNSVQLTDRPGGVVLVVIDSKATIVMTSGAICAFDGMTPKK